MKTRPRTIPASKGSTTLRLRNEMIPSRVSGLGGLAQGIRPWLLL
ncbi:hypothetical protein [Chamaesiphon sp. VAR_48_metabat_135_sub]|nr:hypothetical protein [Chamaesiphon sp. VAR_48_metabat_135_sub]